jgi:hypothetical protein
MTMASTTTNPTSDETKKPIAVFGAAAERSRDLVRVSLETWADENRAYFDDLARDCTEALNALQRCKSPIELLGVERKWLLARSQSVFDASMRMVAGSLHEAENTAARLASFRLPE